MVILQIHRRFFIYFTGRKNYKRWAHEDFCAILNTFPLFTISFMFHFYISLIRLRWHYPFAGPRKAAAECASFLAWIYIYCLLIQTDVVINFALDIGWRNTSSHILKLFFQSIIKINRQYFTGFDYCKYASNSTHLWYVEHILYSTINCLQSDVELFYYSWILMFNCTCCYKIRWAILIEDICFQSH